MISLNDLVIIGFLVFLEGILSIDNAIVLALISRKLPKRQQKKALTYGLVGAIIFRLIAVGSAAFLMKWRWIKFIGAAYLIWISGKHFIHKKADSESHSAHSYGNFWKTVFLIELTDIAFAIDSILAAMGLTQKIWIIFIGGIIGTVIMRFAAALFVGLLERFPAFEASGYLLVALIGSKLLIEGFHLPGVDFESSNSWGFWIFWVLMLGGILYGFKPSRKSGTKVSL